MGKVTLLGQMKTFASTLKGLLDNKVDKTQYASTTQAGIVKLYTSSGGSNISGLSISDTNGSIHVATNSSKGTQRTGSGEVIISAATTSDIDTGTSSYKPIVPSTLSYAVQSVGGKLEELSTTAQDSYVAAINEVAGDSHTHSNKAVLDEITAEKVAEWDAGTGTGNVTVDTKLTETSTNPVTSKAIWDYIGDIDPIAPTGTLVDGIRLISDDIGDLETLDTTVKTDLVSAINEVAGSSGGGVTVDAELSTTSENPVQNKVVTAAINEAISSTADSNLGIPVLIDMSNASVNDGVTLRGVTWNVSLETGKYYRFYTSAALSAASSIDTIVDVDNVMILINNDTFDFSAFNTYLCLVAATPSTSSNGNYEITIIS